MTLSAITSIALALLSIAVLVQTARLMIVFRRFKRADLSETVTALDHATAAAQAVLDNLRTVLAVEARAHSAVLASSQDHRAQLVALRDELSVMVEVGNNVAERIEVAADAARVAPSGAAATTGRRDDEPPATQAPALKPLEIRAKPRRRGKQPAAPTARPREDKSAMARPNGPSEPVALEAGA